MFCVGRLDATPRKNKVETVMFNRVREDGIGMGDNMSDIRGRVRRRSCE